MKKPLGGLEKNGIEKTEKRQWGCTGCEVQVWRVPAFSLEEGKGGSGEERL
jgi:hypothetical protein